MDSILTEPINQEDLIAKLRLYMIHHFEHAVKNRDMIIMVSRDVSSKAAMASIHTIFRQVPETLNRFFKLGQDKGFIKTTTDTFYLGDCFLSPIFMQVLFAEMLMEPKDVFDPAFRERFISELIENLLTGVLVK